MESRGYRVGIISQPDWHSAEPFKKLGRPRLAALITAGNLDSMLNEKTAAKKFRSRDSYSPGGEAGHRPERATIVYANRMREAYKDVPIIIGGIEASLRRFAHYDYWSNKVRHSILLDSKADILSYGMGEHSVVEIADALAEGKTVAEMYDIRGICYVTSRPPISDKTVVCPSYEDIKKDKLTFARLFQDAVRRTGILLRQDYHPAVREPLRRPDAAGPAADDSRDGCYLRNCRFSGARRCGAAAAAFGPARGPVRPQ